MIDFTVETKRLYIRKATSDNNHIDFFYNLWTNPRVMINVGFPNGLIISRNDIKKILELQPETEYNALLIVVLKETGELIGESKLGSPDKDGIATTDIKLLSKFWGKKYGVEIKQTLVDYLFENTDCTYIKATPNRNNIASQRMQESVGGVKVGEGLYRFPEKMRGYTIDIPYFEYRIYRGDWKRQKTK
ncbi:MAG: GNAT family protein [Candidatus Zixiibacteriota bacterium]